MLSKPDPEVGDSILLPFPIFLFKVTESQNLRELSRNPYIKVSFSLTAMVNPDCWQFVTVMQGPVLEYGCP